MILNIINDYYITNHMLRIVVLIYSFEPITDSLSIDPSNLGRCILTTVSDCTQHVATCGFLECLSASALSTIQRSMMFGDDHIQQADSDSTLNTDAGLEQRIIERSWDKLHQAKTN